MARFFVNPENITADKAIIEGDELRHLAQVLRLRLGEQLVLLDDIGMQYDCVLEELTKERATARIFDRRENVAESDLRLWLAQGLPKGDKMEEIVKKAVELGVTGIIPLEMNRCVVRLDTKEKKISRQERLQKVAREAVKQCGRSRTPVVMEPCALVDIKDLLDDFITVVPWEEGGIPIKDWIQSQSGRGLPDKDIIIVIGPEGGIEKCEIDYITQSGGIAVSLGQRILRTETAGPAVISVLQYEWGDLG